ncbi:MAG TPA: amino acid permease, partial [Gammaproteobacteria bacterium]|nr:amino acid permease [Gammaproteobacteria bacterium]
IIGAGVFVLSGVVAANIAGPAIIISYLISGLAAFFAALSYAELAASIGGCGSAYNYAYVGFGELIAWLIGWNLIFEYGLSISTVAIGWSGYIKDILLAISLPSTIASLQSSIGHPINILAISIIMILSILLCVGVRESAKFNAVIVFIKLLAIVMFIIAAIPNLHSHNWVPFFPFGWSGAIQGAALVFFAYIGFDALSTATEETIQPQRNIPIGIMASMILCTLIYIVVAALLTGIVPYQTLNVSSPVASALLTISYPITAGIISAGAVAGLTTVMLVMFYGLTRIVYAMARDGLLPAFFAKVNARTQTPIPIIIVSGIIMATFAGYMPINRAAELVNIGTLTAFTVVCAGTIILRYTRPEMPRPFKLPLSPYIPALGIIFCIYLMINLPAITWLRFAVWLIAGIAIYFLYGKHHSLLAKNNATSSIHS